MVGEFEAGLLFPCVQGWKDELRRQPNARRRPLRAGVKMAMASTSLARRSRIPARRGGKVFLDCTRPTTWLFPCVQG